MKLLTHVDGDEISLVSRAANRRKFLLLKGDSMEGDLSEILEVPWEREGALLDEIRKDGIQDETVEKAVLAAVRLLKGVEDEFSPELIAKLGAELYPHSNRTLNTGTGIPAVTDLDGDCDSEEDEEVNGDADGADKDGDASGDGLKGGGSAPKVAADSDGDDTEPDDDADDKKKRPMKKADFSASSRKDLASQGKALPDGSFPIRNTSDLGNAVQAVGRAKDPGRAKAWIIRRARALGSTGSLPDSWHVSKEDDSLLEKSDDFVIDDERGTVETHAVPVQKEDGSWDFSDVPDETRPFYKAMIEKADATAAELALTRSQLAKADETLLSRTMIEKAARYNHVAAVDDLAPILKEASLKLDPESFEKLEKLFESAEQRVKSGSLFKEMGRTGLGSDEGNQDAEARLVSKANELVEKGTDVTFEVAYDRVMRANPELYAEYLTDHGWGV